MEKITVSFKRDYENYPIYFANNLDAEIIEFIKQYQSKIVVISNKYLASLFADSPLFHLSNAQYYLIEDNETSKSIENCEAICEWMMENHCDRKSVIVALGGGVVGDLAGTVAAAFQRGIDLIQVPTTLLAQVDSSVGGKVAVNLRNGKNSFGFFYQPKAVFMASSYLLRLDRRELIAALAEILKYGFIYDEEFYHWTKTHSNDILAKNNTILQEAAIRSVIIKKSIVEKDERESSLRSILNFGHSFGHALELAGNYQELRHGEAVLRGMIAALVISEIEFQQDFTEEKVFLNQLFPYTNPNNYTIDQIHGNMFFDKKNQAGQLQLVGIEAIGKAVFPIRSEERHIRNAIKYMLGDRC